MESDLSLGLEHRSIAAFLVTWPVGISFQMPVLMLAWHYGASGFGLMSFEVSLAATSIGHFFFCSHS